MIRHKLHPIILAYSMILNHLQRLTAVDMIDNRLRRGGVSVVGGVIIGTSLWCNIAGVVHYWSEDLEGGMGRLDIHISAQDTHIRRVATEEVGELLHTLYARGCTLMVKVGIDI